MEITNDNFKEDGLPKFREACAWADFIALDTEFSGKFNKISVYWLSKS